VQLACSIDGWREVNHLVLRADGCWEIPVTVPADVDQFEYKFIVDGKWVYDLAMPQARDQSGNVNNRWTAPDTFGFARPVSAADTDEDTGVKTPLTPPSPRRIKAPSGRGL
jgi:1,4-alpha-glucan branching enzyme